MTWPEVALGEVATWSSGGTPKRTGAHFFGNEVPWASIADLNDGPLLRTKEGLTAAGIQNSSAKILKPDTLLIAMYGSIGKLGITTTETCTSQAIAAAVPKSEVLDLRFLFHFLLSQRPALQSAGRGGTQSNIGQADLKSWMIPLPPLDEQRRIAAILDHADSLRQRNERARNLSGSLNESIYLSMFAATTASATVEEVASPRRGSIRTGPFGSQLKREELIDEGVAVLGLDNVVSNEFRWGRPRFISEEKYATLARYTVLPGDVLISIMGTVGRSVVVPDGIRRSINTKHICAISTESSKMLPEFLRASFLWHPEAREHLRRQTKGSIMNGLNMGIIKSLPLPQPDLETQEKFVRLCSSAARLTKTSASAGFDTLFASLQARAFRGEL